MKHVRHALGELATPFAWAKMPSLILTVIAQMLFSVMIFAQEPTLPLSQAPILLVASTQRVSKRPSAPVGDFYVTFNSTGLIGVSNPAWMETVPELKQSLENVGRYLASKISGGRLLTLVISQRGVITSSDTTIVPNGASAAGLLLEYGQHQVARRVMTIQIPEGIVFEPPLDLTGLPQMAATLERSQVAARLQSNVNPNLRRSQPSPLRITLEANGRLISSDPRLPKGCFDLWNPFSGPEAMRDKYKEFKECVGDYWWAPGLNVLACGAGLGISVLLE